MTTLDVFCWINFGRSGSLDDLGLVSILGCEAAHCEVGLPFEPGLWKCVHGRIGDVNLLGFF